MVPRERKLAMVPASSALVLTFTAWSPFILGEWPGASLPLIFPVYDVIISETLQPHALPCRAAVLSTTWPGLHLAITINMPGPPGSEREGGAWQI